MPDDGKSFGAYWKDGMNESSLNINLTCCNSVIEGTFDAILAGENSYEQVSGSFSIPVSN
ncbi:MAG: hypothetical protein JXR68_07805 [Bacteroidales bacterium]|nr:hypothetical protein [Bacteroidales bacterium]